MFDDARNVEDGARIETDLCIVGAGPAGITLALELAGRGLRILLLEAGGLEAESATPSIYRGESVGVLYYPLSSCRLRYFGGTTNHWGGACWPLEPIDFEARPGVPHSGWPISRDDLDPFYPRAHELCQIGPADFRAETWAGPDRPVLPLPGEPARTKLYQDSPPTRFGQVYREALRTAQDIRVLLRANVVELEPDEAVRRLERVHVATLEGRRFEVVARQVVLATGALENARLLLASNRVAPRGLGNDRDRVGRFFQEHPMLRVGQLLLSRPFDPTFYTRHQVRGQWIRAGLGLSEETLRREKLLNCWFGFLLPGNVPATTQAERSYRHLRRSLRRGEWPEDFARHLGVVVRHADELLFEEEDEAQGGMRPDGTTTGPLGLFAHAEQSPNPESRVRLTEDRDRLGLPRLQLDWRLAEIDHRSLRRTLEVLAGAVGEAGFGRLGIELEDDPSSWTDAARASEDGGPRGSFHHMGTTRMHASPGQGVVDRDCRVHGLENLYVAGSSVFTTCGYANPTLTIVALALRLSGHLHERLRGA